MLLNQKGENFCYRRSSSYPMSIISRIPDFLNLSLHFVTCDIEQHMSRYSFHKNINHNGTGTFIMNIPPDLVAYLFLLNIFIVLIRNEKLALA